MSNSTPVDVFIIHADGDAYLVADLTTALRAANLSTFSREDLQLGDNWHEVLPARLADARAVAILITNHWPGLGSKSNPFYGPEEVAGAIYRAQAVESSPRLIPICIDGAVDRVPYGLRRVRGLHVAGRDFHEAARTIAAALQPRGLPIPNLSTAVTRARKRVAELKRVGADEDVILEAQERVLEARRARRDGRALLSGDTISNRYTLLRHIGAGGFAAVWVAMDTECNRTVAVKILHGRWSQDRSRIERFQRGAHRMASLDHESIVKVLEPPAVHDGRHYYVMEYLSGGNLTVARSEGHLSSSPDAALLAVLQIARALSVVHRQGMVHRDVKPANILFTSEGWAKLADFDFVRADDSTGGTRSGPIGTFFFAAPEALRSGKDVTHQADIYSLAVTAVFALTGFVPSDIIRQPDHVVSQLETAPAIRSVIAKALSWDPQSRQQSIDIFSRELLAAMRLAQPPPARMAPIPPPMPPDDPTQVDVVSAQPRKLPVARVVGLPRHMPIHHLSPEVASAPRSLTPAMPGGRRLHREAPELRMVPAGPLAMPQLSAVSPDTRPVSLDTRPVKGRRAAISFDTWIKVVSPPVSVLEVPSRGRHFSRRQATFFAMGAFLAGLAVVGWWHSTASGAATDTRAVTHGHPVQAVDGGPTRPGAEAPPGAVTHSKHDRVAQPLPLRSEPAPVTLKRPEYSGPSASTGELRCPGGMRLMTQRGFPAGGQHGMAVVGPGVAAARAGLAYCIEVYEYPGRGKLPHTGVDFETAQELCLARERRLCTDAEWRLGCAGRRGAIWPYGNGFDPLKCNTRDTAGDERTLAPSGTFGRCKSIRGIHDMSGNAAEWTADQTVRGGDAASTGEDASCNSGGKRAPGHRRPSTGFRCCTDFAE